MSAFLGLLIKEAIHSTALEHLDGCGCDVCKAAAGDVDALARIWMAAEDAERRSAR